MLLEVLLCCKATHQGCWLHVDLVNSRASGLYESIGFKPYLIGPDPYGSMGYYMLYFECGWNAGIKEGATLFNTPQCQTEETFGRCVALPPLMAGI